MSNGTLSAYGPSTASTYRTNESDVHTVRQRQPSHVQIYVNFFFLLIKKKGGITKFYILSFKQINRTINLKF